MGIMNWLSERVEQKIRLSQIRGIYQNYFVVEFLLANEKIVLELRHTQDRQNFDDFVAYKRWLEDQIVSLTYKSVLPEQITKELLIINTILKNIYSAQQHGRLAAKALFGATADGVQDFSTRFSPAGGWRNFSDREWDALVDVALKEERGQDCKTSSLPKRVYKNLAGGVRGRPDTPMA